LCQEYIFYRYPVCFPKAPRKLYNGHSSHVTRVKFSHDDHYVYSTGGLDKCVMVWKTDFGTGEIIVINLINL
jgi:WD40 repeat protein